MSSTGSISSNIIVFSDKLFSIRFAFLQHGLKSIYSMLTYQVSLF